MIVQAAAKIIVNRYGRPMKSCEIAALALREGMVKSSANDPIASFVSTLEKNVRNGVEPHLVFVYEDDERLVGLPVHAQFRTKHVAESANEMMSVSALVPKDAVNRLLCKASISSPERASIRTAELWRGGHPLADSRATIRRTTWFAVLSAAFERQLEGPRGRGLRC